MRTIIPLLLTVLLFGLIGCNRGPSGSVEGPAGEKLTLGVPEKTSVKQGGEEKFSVAVNREKMHGDVKITFAELPEKVTVVEKEGTIPDGKNEIFFTLKAEEGAPPVKEKKVKVNAALGNLKAEDWLRVTVNENLEHRAAKKEAFVKATENRLNEVKKQLDAAQEHIQTLKDSNKSDYLKRLSNLVDYKDQASKKFNELKATPIEQWERLQGEVTNALNSLEKSTKTLVEEVKKAK